MEPIEDIPRNLAGPDQKNSFQRLGSSSYIPSHRSFPNRDPNQHGNNRNAQDTRNNVDILRIPMRRFQTQIRTAMEILYKNRISLKITSRIQCFLNSSKRIGRDTCPILTTCAIISTPLSLITCFFQNSRQQ